MRRLGFVLATTDDILWARLEGRADLFETTRLRYRALLGMARGLFWRERLRRNVELLREVAQTQAEVEAAIAATRRRAAAEGWPERRGPLRLVQQVEQLARELEIAVARRRRGSLGPKNLSLPAALLALEADLLGAPRPLLSPGSALKAANELLPRNLPELRQLVECAQHLEALAGRPESTDGAFPLQATEAVLLSSALEKTGAAVRALRARVATLEPTGTVLRTLEQRARQPPRRAPQKGGEQFLHGAFWLQLAHARAGRWLEAFTGPLRLHEEEIAPVLRWIGTALGEPEARLSIGEARSLRWSAGEDDSTTAAPPRAALLELSVRLSSVLSRKHLLAHSPGAIQAAARLADGADPVARAQLLGALSAALGRPVRTLAESAELLLPTLAVRSA